MSEDGKLLKFLSVVFMVVIIINTGQAIYDRAQKHRREKDDGK